MGEEPPPWIQRIPPVHGLAVDCVIASGLLMLLAAHAAQHRQAGPAWLAITASVVTAAPLAVRRVRPAAVLATVLSANTLLIVLGASGDPAVAVAVALHAVALSRPPRRSLAVTAGAAGVSAAAQAYSGLAGHPPLPWQTAADIIAASTAIAVAAWAIGAAARGQRRYAARLAEDQASRAAADERLRIARELHDVISHSMTLITAKAAVAGYLIQSHPEEAGPALAVIEETGRGALGEMRRMLGVLRSDDGTAPPGAPAAVRPGSGDGTGIARAPAPGLSGLEALAADATAAGVTTRLEIRGKRELPDALALSVYRIVQEALTNVIKHAGPARCHVRVDLTPDAIAIDVADDGHAPAGTTGGYGLIGMRERVRLYGGELSAGPQHDGGYRVAVRIPVSPVSPAGPATAPRGGRPA